MTKSIILPIIPRHLALWVILIKNVVDMVGELLLNRVKNVLDRSVNRVVRRPEDGPVSRRKNSVEDSGVLMRHEVIHREASPSRWRPLADVVQYPQYEL